MTRTITILEEVKRWVLGVEHSLEDPAIKYGTFNSR